MKNISRSLIALLFVGAIAAADHHEMSSSMSASGKVTGAAAEAVLGKPSFHASQSQVVTAVVEAINHETREVTLGLANGESVSFVASEQARNLPQVKVGDLVTAEYIEDVSIEVMANPGLEAEAAEAVAMMRTEEGDMPGGAVVDQTVVTATVEEINLEANTFKLKGPEGNVREFTARNPDNLRRSEVGDLVVFTTTRAVAVSVEHVETEAAE